MRPHYASSVAPAAPQKQQYFEGNRKGEVNELKVMMKNTLNEKDDKKKREVVKKVIAYMTLGIDVSRLFPEMCMASYTNDLIQKKMIYLYLTTYAESNKDLAFMAISTFQRDCKQPDAKIRGFALRNLCSLRFAGAFEFLMPAIREALTDMDAYVRKTAIMGLVKVYYMQKEEIRDDIEDQLYKMINDNDPLVIINAIHALNEILVAEGGMALSRKMVEYLLNRLKEFNEWGQATILDQLSKYTPREDKEMFDIMNILEERLKHSCSAIVLAVIKVFMNFTKDKPKIYEQVISRIKAPLITLALSSEGNYEVTFTILAHIKLIASKGYQVFASDYKCFYCRADEPSYNKFLKLEILSLIATDNNLGDMLNELGEYVTDVDAELSKKSIQALGVIAIRLPELASAIVKQLSSFLSLQKDYITNEVVIAFKDILRKDPKHIKDSLEIVQLDNISDTNSKISLIYILGQYGAQIPLAPYILENYVGSDEPLEVKHALLCACVKLFFQRAPEMQSILGRLFKAILGSDTEDIDLKDRAAFYYRALQTNPSEIKNLWQYNRKVDKFLEEININKESLLFEFNSLSVVYQIPEVKYLKPLEYFNTLRNKERQQNQEEEALHAAAQQQETPTETAQPSTIQPQQDLLDIAPPQQLTVNNFAEQYPMDAETFESWWMSLQDGATFTRMLARNDIANGPTIEALFQQNRFYNLAEEEIDNVLKMYFYGKHDTQVFLEFEINRNLSTVILNIRAEVEDMAFLVSRYVEEFLKQSGLI